MAVHLGANANVAGASFELKMKQTFLQSVDVQTCFGEDLDDNYLYYYSFWCH